MLANFGKNVISDCPFICLFVFLSVRFTILVSPFDQSTPNVAHIYLGSGYMCMIFRVDDIIAEVTRSKNRSDFEIAITSLICELERRSKAQSVGHTLGYPDNVLNLWWHFRRETSLRPYNFLILKILEIECSFNLTSNMERSSQIIQEQLFLWRWCHGWRHRETSDLSL